MVKGFSFIAFLFFVLSLTGSVSSSSMEERFVMSFDLDTAASSHYAHYHPVSLTKNPIEFPADSDPFPVEKDEKEDLDNQQWNKNGADFHHESELQSDQHSRSLVQFEQQILNRSKRSLVVLHHCWKNQLI